MWMVSVLFQDRHLKKIWDQLLNDPDNVNALFSYKSYFRGAHQTYITVIFKFFSKIELINTLFNLPNNYYILLIEENEENSHENYIRYLKQSKHDLNFKIKRNLMYQKGS